MRISCVSSSSSIYVPKWTRELFIMRRCVPTTTPTYELSDELGEPIKGKFYTQELSAFLRTKAIGSRRLSVRNTETMEKSGTTFTGWAI